MNLDKPKWEVITFVQQLIEEKKPEVMAVVSGRSEKQREDTLKQLSAIGIEPNEVVLRAAITSGFFSSINCWTNVITSHLGLSRFINLGD